MLRTLKKFFAFCGAENRKLFVTSIWLGVVSAICSAMRIPAAAIVIQALLQKNVTMATLWTSLGVIVASLIVTIAINMKTSIKSLSMMPQHMLDIKRNEVDKSSFFSLSTVGSFASTWIVASTASRSSCHIKPAPPSPSSSPRALTRRRFTAPHRSPRQHSPPMPGRAAPWRSLARRTRTTRSRRSREDWAVCRMATQS